MRRNVFGLIALLAVAALTWQCQREVPLIKRTETHPDRPGRGPKADTLEVITKLEGGLQTVSGVRVDIYYSQLDFDNERNAVATEFSDQNGIARFVIKGVPRPVWGRGFVIHNGDTLRGIMKDAQGNPFVQVRDLSIGVNTGIIEMKK